MGLDGTVSGPVLGRKGCFPVRGCFREIAADAREEPRVTDTAPHTNVSSFVVNSKWCIVEKYSKLKAQKMKKELFKELNAHVRACDNKSIALNAAYVGGLLFANSTRADDRFIGEAAMAIGFHEDLQYPVLLAALTLAGYVVFFIQLWFRAWKVHYLNVIKRIYDENIAEFGENVPVWMLSNTPIMSWDNVFRMLPFFVNIALLANLSAQLVEEATSFWQLFFPLAALHFVVSVVLVRIVSREMKYQA